VIQQLKDTIQEINTLTHSEQRYMKRETRAHEHSVKQRCLARETSLVDERASLQAKLDEEERSHDKTVEFLTRQREVLEKQIQEWMQRYEEDTESKTSQVDALKQQRTADLDRFEELAARYEELEKVVEDDHRAKQLAEEEAKLNAERDAMAIRIQAWWRGVRCRRELARQSKKSAKGKKKSAKGGKKRSAGASSAKKSAGKKKK
jgi:seryl-tRNA synthetase